MIVRLLRIRQVVVLLMLAVATSLAFQSPVWAAEATSSNYGVSEVKFGSGGELRACSTTYCSKQSAGELTVGNTKSANYQTEAGYNTNRDPLLEVTVTSPVIDLGYLTPGTTKFGTAAFSVRTYLASGYNVSIDGTSPRNNSNGHVLSPMSTAAASQAGIEQFGINLRANTSPAVGTDPAQIPDSTFSFGAPAAGYDTVNSFKYVPGDVIASSASSSGQTDYTMSVIANVSTITAGGAYGGRLFVNVVPTF